MDNNLLEKFIGDNYKKITTRQFNISGFFFGSLYLFYRKLYLYGLLVFIVNLIINILLNNIFVGLFINILIAVFVNKIYVSYANNKINKIKEFNKDKSDEELEKICKVQGGTSVPSVIIGFLVEILLTGIYIAVAILIFGININKFVKFNNNDTVQPIEESENSIEDDYVPGIFNGGLMIDDINVKNEFTMEVPSIFTDNDYAYEYNYEYENKETEEFFKTCSISMSAVKDFSSSLDLINQMAKYYKDQNASKVENEEINNIKWSSFYTVDDIGKTYYYANTKNNQVYVLRYEIQVGADSKCEQYRKEIINSIKIK